MTNQHKRNLISFISILLLTISASAQRMNTVNFVRPGESQPVSAYNTDFVDVAPEFPGGESAMLKFISSERQYPREAYEAGIQGRVICEFIVDTDGSILDIRAFRGPSSSLCREAVRIISSMPKWTAGKVDNHNVPVRCYLTIPFRI